VQAPKRLSVIHNAEETVEFFTRLHHLYQKRRKVWVSLSNVTQISYDAIVALLAAMIRFKAAGIGFNGDKPGDAYLRRLLDRSGFFDLLFKEIPDKPRYQITSEDTFHTHASKQVDSQLSAAIVQAAARTVWGEEKRCPGIQRIFVELMQNTLNHASPLAPGEKHWWISTYHDRKSNRVAFSFLDFGVGIFRSLEDKPAVSKWFGWRQLLARIHNPNNNAELLHLILEGELHRTVTGQPFRGKGLPGIREVLRRNQVSNLRIVTNDVYADVTQGEYRTLKNNFTGTLVYWELHADDHPTIPEPDHEDTLDRPRFQPDAGAALRE